jgi:phosphoribosyl 1,2-cyclic phosphodiesterase
MDDKLEVRFWGVRGSIPSPGADTVIVGGNTSCVEIVGGGTRLILDAGTGLRPLGDHLVAQRQTERVNLLLSHVHWDHVMGLPFFVPLYMPSTTIEVMTGPAGPPLAQLLHRQMSAPMFPVDIRDVASRVVCRDLCEGERFAVGALSVEVARLRHPDPVYAYRIEYGGRSVVYATDTEHVDGCVDRSLVQLAGGADVLIYDAQYTPEEYPSKVGWGHSTFAAGSDVALAAGVGTLALFHHDPRRTDDQVAGIVRRARERFPSTVAAREQLALALPAHGSSLAASA